jgi:hypothetical protein
MGKNEYYKKRNEMRMSQQNKSKVAEVKPRSEVQVQKLQNDAPKGLQNESQKETTKTKTPFRDSKWNNRNNNYKNTRTRTVETAEDITEDIIRIEKEIKMEVQEIKTIKL